MPRKPRASETPEQAAYMARREHQNVLAGTFGELYIKLAQLGMAGCLDHPDMLPIVHAAGKALDLGIEPPSTAESEV